MDRVLLQIPFPEYSQSSDKIDRDIIISSYVACFISFSIFVIAAFQFVGMMHVNYNYCKKVIHLSIMAQMIGCFLQNLEIGPMLFYPCWVFFSIQEFIYISSLLSYFVMLLFWTNFYYGITYGKTIWPLKNKIFGIAVSVVMLLYLTAFTLYCYKTISTFPQGWEMLRNRVYWWHAPAFIFISLSTVFVAIKISINFPKIPCRHQRRRKTNQALLVIAVVTVLRSVMDGLFEHMDFNSQLDYLYWQTWAGFFTFFMLEYFIPSLLFLFILREIPKERHAVSYRYGSLPGNIN